MKRIIILLAQGLIFTALGFAQIDLQPVATVRLTRSEPITVRQLKNEVEKQLWSSLVSRLGRIPTAAELNTALLGTSVQDRRQVLEVMVNNKLALQAAERDRITITDNEVNQQLQQFRSNVAQALGRQPTDAEFAQAVRNNTGQELPAFREEIRQTLIIQKYLMEKKGDSFRSIRVPTEQEIINSYNLYRARFVRPETVRFSMIQVPFTDAPSKVKAKEIADRLVRDIGTNASRFDAAVLRGQTPNAEYQAGDAGYLPRDIEAQQLVGTEFMNTAFTLRQGEVSRLLENTRGYQIIKVTETYELKNLELDDIYQLGEPMTVRDFIGNSILNERQQAVLAQAQQELITELRSGNPFQINESLLNW